MNPKQSLLRRCLAAKCTALTITLVAASFAPAVVAAQSAGADELARTFVAPPNEARPWVYWYFMDGNVTRDGLHADLEAMKAAGIGGAIYLEVGIGARRGASKFLSEF